MNNLQKYNAVKQELASYAVLCAGGIAYKDSAQVFAVKLVDVRAGAYNTPSPMQTADMVAARLQRMFDELGCKPSACSASMYENKTHVTLAWSK